MNDSIPVLHVVNGEFYAGAERVQDLLAQNLPAFGYRVGFACLKGGLFGERIGAKDAAVHTVAMRGRYDLTPAFRLARLATSGGYRLIHTHTPRSVLIGSLASILTGLPLVHHVHSPAARDTEARWRNVCNAATERLGISRATALVCVSRNLEEELYQRGVSPGRVRTVWNGVPMRDRLGRRRVPGERFIVGTVALLRPRKGVEVLVDAAAALRDAGVDIGLRIVGPFETDTYRDAVLQRAHALRMDERIEWTGFSADIAAELGRMHVFVLPSLYGEGLPMVVLEAMAAGVPVVATRIEGLEAVIRDGRDGLLVRPGDCSDLAKALRSIASGEVDVEALGNSAWLRQRAMFSERAMASGVAEIYREALEARALKTYQGAGRN